MRGSSLVVVAVLIGNSALASGQEKREALLGKLEAARAVALERIFDTATYKDEDHGRSGQADVDAAVDGVRAVYARVRPLLDGDAAKLEKQAARRSALLSAPESELGAWEKALRRHLIDRATLARNEAKAPKGSPGLEPTPAEREQVRHTNEHRLLLGRGALAIDARLVASARGHAEEMRRLGYFSHTSPTPGRKTMKERIALAGVEKGPVGENIATGYRSARAAFEGWYRSAPHHRNMLGSWTHMGTGSEGDLWTQNYAAE